MQTKQGEDHMTPKEKFYPNGRKLKKPPLALPSGWAALLHLYDLR
jgi:hypothetical protein